MGVPRRVPSGATPPTAGPSEEIDGEKIAEDKKRSTGGLSGRMGASRVLSAWRCLVCVVLAMQLVGAPASTAKGGDIEVSVKVPKEAQVGSSVELRCDWRLLGQNGLYSVKWYKDDHEFFRYVPDDNPKIQTFPQPGVNLDRRTISENSIKLRDLGLTSTGQYKCEVSTEGPSFATTYETANLTVIALPEKAPEITGLSSQYAVGENVTANCTAWPSVPKATIHWSINGETVPQEKTIQYPALSPVSTKGIPSSLGLRIEAEPRFFEGRGGGRAPMRIKCIAEVGSKAFETQKEVPMAYVNNERLSAGDIRGNGRELRGDALWPVLLLVLVLLAT